MTESNLLRAGPLSLVLVNGDIRHVRYGAHEVVRRIYVAVRDQWWNTIPARLNDLQIESDDDSFRVTYHAAHTRGAIDFRWQATIEGTAAGTVALKMDGVAHKTFLRNRIGICVLHPVAECAGQPCMIEHTNGTIERSEFPQFISPHQPFMDVRAISHEITDKLTAEVRLTGETFETEDQRNWTDASFKTYSTPLALPFPVEVEQGTVVRQSVTLSLQGVAEAARSIVHSTAAEEREVVFMIEGSSGFALPRLGLGVASHNQPLGETELERLRALNLSHLRVDLDLSQAEHEAILLHAWHEARTLGIKLEVALFLTDGAANELQRFARLLEEVQPAIYDWLVFRQGEKVTGARWLELAREHLAGYDSSIRFGGGTNNYFTELNRERPSTAALALMDFVSYSLNPQVHASDDLSLIENLQAQAETITSARRFVGNLPIAISPVTLKPRFNPHAVAAGIKPAIDELPPQVDARQATLFGAAWTAGSIKHLAESGAHSVTYYETSGWRGVMERESGSPLPTRFPSLPDAVFPLYHVLADAGEFAEGEVIRTKSRAPLAVNGFAVSKANRTRLVLANMQTISQQIKVRDLNGRLQNGQARIRRLNETNVEAAMRSPDEYRRTAMDSVRVADGELTLDLLPHEIVRIDVE